MILTYARKYYNYNPLIHEWEEISEEIFDNEVVKFRSLYNMRYEDSARVRIFSDIDTGQDMYKVVKLDIPVFIDFSF